MNIKKAEQLLSRLRRRVDFLDDGGRSIKPTHRAIQRVKKLYGFDKPSRYAPKWLSVYEIQEKQV